MSHPNTGGDTMFFITVSVIHSIDVYILRVTLGIVRHLRCIPAHFIALWLGAVKLKSSLYIPSVYRRRYYVFHWQQREETAWGIWKAYDNPTHRNLPLNDSGPTQHHRRCNINNTMFHCVEVQQNQLVVRCGCRTNGAFARKGWGIEDTPPTSNALILHFRRNAYCWFTTHPTCTRTPSSFKLGLVPNWTMAAVVDRNFGGKSSY